MVGLTRFFHLMNLCEKSATWANVYRHFSPFKKRTDFQTVKILFVLQEVKAFSTSAARREIIVVKKFGFSEECDANPVADNFKKRCK
jgi:hypothetical protein